MPLPTQDFCFCTLALREKYRLLAQQLATDLAEQSPGTQLVVGTDRPEAFQSCSNVLAFELHQQGILHCYHDKRFVLRRALTQYRTAIQIDADSRIVQPLPELPPRSPGVSSHVLENLLAHVSRYTPERLRHLQKLAEKLQVPLEKVSFVGEALFSITNDDAQIALRFLDCWDLVARYLELHGIHAGEGNAIGLAAAKVGLTVAPASWLDPIDQALKHLDASAQGRRLSQGQKLQRRLRYHYRLNLARLQALQNFDFYYR
ncbi:MAG: hypothetical protein HC886_03365 [Leptolyngbyaceae cyanobacterium SM1_1_3]|nr:hypothetical protein [Leptolyngbyaceae cyanobacterium SM1_1_3]NJN02126.1 hypothetical protein [Leptolyngbyaceae cyanobacterium RM1_1_2]NJO11126.1 hypothetical protein [Leptolyngbyaceae cyanobacterium SL_1_1]